MHHAVLMRKRKNNRFTQPIGDHQMKSNNSVLGFIIVAAIVGLAGLASAQGGGMMGNGNDYGHGMMNQDRGYKDRMGNYGHGNLSRQDADRLQQSKYKFDEATRGLQNDIRDKQETMQDEMDKADPDPGKAHRLQSELSQLRAQYDREALNYQLEIRNLGPNGEGGQGYAPGND
jgi:Spy/CpxP family protein refolding chaperone